VDENGVTHYTASPPKNETITATKITASGVQVNPGERQRAEDRLRISRDQFTSGAAERALGLDSADTEDKDRKKLYAQYCQDAKRNLKLLSENARVRQKDPKTGEMVMVPEESRISQQAEARRQIKDFCS